MLNIKQIMAGGLKDMFQLFRYFCIIIFDYRKNNLKKLVKNLLLLILFFVFLIGCSPLTTNQNSDQSGQKLLYFAEQYRNISSVMSNKYVERDYDSISSLLVEAVGIAQNVKELHVSEKYEKAKNYAEDWMYSDAYWFYLAISGGSQQEISSVYKESMNYLSMFLNEMESLGHDLE